MSNWRPPLLTISSTSKHVLLRWFLLLTLSSGGCWLSFPPFSGNYKIKSQGTPVINSTGDDDLHYTDPCSTAVLHCGNTHLRFDDSYTLWQHPPSISTTATSRKLFQLAPPFTIAKGSPRTPHIRICISPHLWALDTCDLRKGFIQRTTSSHFASLLSRKYKEPRCVTHVRTQIIMFF